MSKENYIPRLLELYNSEIQENLKKELNLDNIMRVPKLKKISLNIGLGDGKLNKNGMNQAVEELSIISGQKAVLTYAKKAISNFKIRQGDPVGVIVTLRGNMMYEFFDRFISVASPRIRDFRGLSNTGFDGRGNYNFGINEQIIFPEIDYDRVNEIRGMNISIITSAEKDDYANALLLAFGFPLKRDAKKNNKG